MVVTRFYEPTIAQASYLIGCAATGEAIVIDPDRDVQRYVDAAAREGLCGDARHRDAHPRRLPVRRA